LRFQKNDVLKQADAVLELVMTAVEHPSFPGAASRVRDARKRAYGAPPSPQRGEGKQARG